MSYKGLMRQHFKQREQIESISEVFKQVNNQHICLQTQTNRHTPILSPVFQDNKTTWVSLHKKGETFWILLNDRVTNSYNISCCKSYALRSRQTIMPELITQDFFYSRDDLPDPKHRRHAYRHNNGLITGSIYHHDNPAAVAQ